MKTGEPDLKEIPNVETNKCFGCGPLNPSGLRLRFFTDDTSVVTRVTVPAHLCGWRNLVHGGVISTILDETMGRTVIWILKRVGMTKSMKTDFLKPVYIGRELRVEGRILDQTSDREAVIKGVLYNDEGTLCARSRGTFTLFTPEVIRKRGISDEGTLNWLEALFGGGDE